MVDNFKIEFTGNQYVIPSFENIVEIFNTSFYPHHNKEGKYLYHWANIQNNLVAKIDKRRNEVMTIENSLHKFWHGNNFEDFTFSEILQAIDQIEKILNIPSRFLKFKKVEIGINIENNISSFDLLESYKMNDFDRMRSGKKVYGKKIFLTDFDIKYYNKFMETELSQRTNVIGSNSIFIPKNLHRFEIGYKRMRPLAGILTRLSDLRDIKTLQKLGNKLLDTFNLIDMHKDYNFSVLSPRERELVFAGMNSEFWEIEKINENTRKDKRRKYLNCIKRLNENLSEDPKELILDLLSDKLNYLISN